MPSKSDNDQHAGENDFARQCQNVSTTFMKGMAAAPFAVGFNLFWGSTALGLRLFEQMVNTSLRALPPSRKDQKKV